MIKRNTAEGLVRSVFNFEVDSRIIGFSEELSIDRQLFWKDIYVSRKNPENEYEDFLNSESSSLLVINGHVGTGKSTFIRHKFEKIGLNSGLIIDLRGKNNFNYCENQNDVDTATYGIIKNAFLLSIFENIKLNLLSRRKYIITRTDYFDRYDYDLSKNPPKIELTPFEDAELEEHVYFQIALEIINFLSNSDFVKKFRSKYHISGFNSISLRNKVCQVFENNPGLIHEVIREIEWFNLLRLYRKLFDVEKSFVIVFDNFDVVPLKKVKNYFLETLINTSNYLNGNTDYPHNQNINSNHVKLVFSIRDENISRYSRHSRAAFFDTQIIVGNDGFLMTNSNKATRIPIDKRFCYEVIKNRISVLQKHSMCLTIKEEQEILDLFIEITDFFWIDKKKEIIRTGFGYIDIQELSNDSIRLILDFIVDITLGVIPSIIRERKEDPQYQLNYYFLKSKIINELWKHKSTSVILQKIKTGFKKEVENGNYCLYRFVLAFLYKKVDKTATSAEIYHRMYSIFDIDKNNFQDILMDLFNSELKESEFISVYYNNPNEYFENKIEISNDTDVKLNQKGILLIERIIIHIDFFGKITENIHEFYNKTHTQLIPKEFLVYYSSIFNFIVKLRDRHIFLYQTISSEYNNFDNPFDGYEKEFTIRSVFFLERVAESHKQYIKNYIVYNLRSANVINNTKGNFDDLTIEEALELMDSSNPLRQIWNRFYKRLTPEIINKLKKERKELI